MLVCVNSYSASHDNWCTGTLWNRVITAQCEGMGEVGSARYEPALLPPCPSIRALCYSNCQRSTQSHQQSVLINRWESRQHVSFLFFFRLKKIVPAYHVEEIVFMNGWMCFCAILVLPPRIWWLCHVAIPLQQNVLVCLLQVFERRMFGSMCYQKYVIKEWLCISWRC